MQRDRRCPWRCWGFWKHSATLIAALIFSRSSWMSRSRCLVCGSGWASLANQSAVLSACYCTLYRCRKSSRKKWSGKSSRRGQWPVERVWVDIRCTLSTGSTSWDALFHLHPKVSRTGSFCAPGSGIPWHLTVKGHCRSFTGEPLNYWAKITVRKTGTWQENVDLPCITNKKFILPDCSLSPPSLSLGKDSLAPTYDHHIF